MTIQIAQDLRPQFGSARDQGARPTCLAFATSDAHAALRPGWTPLSCEFAYYHAQRRAGRPPTVGSSLAAMLDTLRADGQPAEADWPYLEHLPATPDDYGPPGNVTVFRRGGEQRPGGINEIVTAIAGGRAVLVLMMLSDAFYVPSAAGIISAPASEGPDPLRRHAVVAVAHGMIGTEFVVLVRNSWGAGWGLTGHAWLTAAYLAPRLLRIAILTEEVDVSRTNLAA